MIYHTNLFRMGEMSGNRSGHGLRWENRAGVRPGVRVPGLEMTWNLDTNLAPDPNDSNSF
jgi:hypothetical protein